MILKAYKKLLREFGHQGWWPTTPAKGRFPVYTPRKSLRQNSEQEKLEICLGAILTQNTNWDNVVKALSALKEGKKLSSLSLHQLPQKKLESFIRSSGYFRQKAQRVKGFLRHVKKAKSFQSFLKGPAPSTRQKLLEINGIGPETADSMLLYAQGQPLFVVDAYTRRIGQRWGVLTGKEDYNTIQGLFMRGLPKSAKIYGEYHALLVELAKRFCRKTPMCENCPVVRMCKTGRNS